MTRRLSLSVMLLVFMSGSKSWVVTYSGLSHKYIYRMKVQQKISNGELPLIEGLTLLIFDQHRQLKQTITLTPVGLIEPAYVNDRNARSYITGKNEDNEVADYDYGDVVIADLNFDGKEDIAVKYDSGGAGGPWYKFYLQGEDGVFRQNSYLTDSVSSFPADINPQSKTITVRQFATYTKEGIKTFKYDSKTKKWQLIKARTVKI